MNGIGYSRGILWLPNRKERTTKQTNERQGKERTMGALSGFGFAWADVGLNVLSYALSPSLFPVTRGARFQVETKKKKR